MLSLACTCHVISAYARATSSVHMHVPRHQCILGPLLAPNPRARLLLPLARTFCTDRRRRRAAAPTPYPIPDPTHPLASPQRLERAADCESMHLCGEPVRGHLGDKGREAERLGCGDAIHRAPAEEAQCEVCKGRAAARWAYLRGGRADGRQR